MRISVLSCLVLFTSIASASLDPRQNTTGLGSVPQCAQTCLSNSTNAQTACSDLDIKCLCVNQQYVNSLSCCLATNCDSTDQQSKWPYPFTRFLADHKQRQSSSTNKNAHPWVKLHLVSSVALRSRCPALLGSGRRRPLWHLQHYHQNQQPRQQQCLLLSSAP